MSDHETSGRSHHHFWFVGGDDQYTLVHSLRELYRFWSLYDADDGRYLVCGVNRFRNFIYGEEPGGGRDGIDGFFPVEEDPGVGGPLVGTDGFCPGTGGPLAGTDGLGPVAAGVLWAGRGDAGTGEGACSCIW